MSTQEFGSFPHQVRHKRQTYASLAASTGMLIVGSVIAWPSTALPNLKATTLPNLDTNQEAWMCSIVPLAAVIGGPIFGMCIDKLGRKPTMLITGVLALSGWLLIAFAQYLEELYAGRFITGLSVGSLVMVIPIYVSDITEKEIRGTLATLAQAMSVFAILISFLIGSLVNWKSSALISALFPIIFLTLGFTLPESPRYYLDTGRDADAAFVLGWLRNADTVEEVEFEVEQIRESLAEIEGQPESTLQMLWSNRILTPLLICMTLMMLQQLTGYNALLFFTAEIFQVSGSNHSKLFTIVLGCLLVVVLVLSTITMDVVGRRPLLLISATFMALAHFANGSYLYLTRQGVSVDQISWIPLTSVLVFFAAHAVGFGPIPWVIMSEILPNHVIGLASSIVASIHFTFAFVVTKYFHSVTELVGVDCTFWIFGAWSLIAACFVFKFVPETKLRTLEDIQASLSARLNSRIESSSSNLSENNTTTRDYNTFENPVFSCES